jgi:chemotaxis protein CheD
MSDGFDVCSMGNFSMMRSRTASVPLPGFADFRRHWDPDHKSQIVKILPGQYYVTRQDEMIVTTLGSCISVCIRDFSIGLGGMNHFMLPLKSENRDDEDASHPWNTTARYGNFAMELLINAIIKNGGDKRNLEAKVFGGAKILSHMKDIGRLNIEFIRQYLRLEELPILAEDLGECYPRKVVYSPNTGIARVKRLRPLKSAAIAREEAQYRRDLNRSSISGTIELFDQAGLD